MGENDEQDFQTFNHDRPVTVVRFHSLVVDFYFHYFYLFDTARQQLIMSMTIAKVDDEM